MPPRSSQQVVDVHDTLWYGGLSWAEFAVTRFALLSRGGQQSLFATRNKACENGQLTAVREEAKENQSRKKTETKTRLPLTQVVSRRQAHRILAWGACGLPLIAPVVVVAPPWHLAKARPRVLLERAPLLGEKEFLQVVAWMLLRQKLSC